MAAQLTAGLAVNGIGKRDLNQQMISAFLEQAKAVFLAVFEKAMESK
jgi:hypothetical protein